MTGELKTAQVSEISWDLSHLFNIHWAYSSKPKIQVPLHILSLPVWFLDPEALWNTNVKVQGCELKSGWKKAAHHKHLWAAAAAGGVEILYWIVWHSLIGSETQRRHLTLFKRHFLATGAGLSAVTHRKMWWVCAASPAQSEHLGQPTPILFPNFQSPVIAADDCQRKSMQTSPKQAAGCHKANQFLDFIWLGLQQTKIKMLLGNVSVDELPIFTFL